jgi:uncharacterized protein
VIFVDTSFWVALRNRRDGHHEEATELLVRHARESLLTTNHVRGESWTILRRRAGHRSAVEFLDLLDRSPRVTIHHVDVDLEDRAVRWLRRHDERAYSFVDASSFVVMSSRRMRDVLAFDGDFSAAGFVELRA